MNAITKTGTTKLIALKSGRFVDFLRTKITTEAQKEFKHHVVSGPYQIGVSVFNQDLYRQPVSGIPIWRLSIYCALIGCTVDSYIEFCGFTSTPKPIFNSTTES